MSLQIIVIMEKEQNKAGVTLRGEIKKDRGYGYPFHIVTDVYSQGEFHFVCIADYVGDSTVITVYPHRLDMSRLTACSITLGNILPKKLVSTLHMVSLVHRPGSTSTTISQAQFIVGHRSGQLIVVEYKDRECKVKQRLNRTLKGEGFFSRTTSGFFSSEDTYQPYFKHPIRNYQIHPIKSRIDHSYQVGNFIIFSKELNDATENGVFSNYQDKQTGDFAMGLVHNKRYSTYRNEYYSVFMDQGNITFILQASQELCSYTVIQSKQELVLCINDQLIIIDIQRSFQLKAIVTLDSFVRRVKHFTFNEQNYLAITVYENYLQLYCMDTNSHCKLVGHRSFIANTAFDQKAGRILSAGMDHRIGLMTMASIKPENWVQANQDSRTIRLEKSQQQRFQQIFSISQGNEFSISRNNLHSYGFGDCTSIGECFCLPTFDHRVMIYSFP